jgi:hypothetical protein
MLYSRAVAPRVLCYQEQPYKNPDLTYLDFVPPDHVCHILGKTSCKADS